MTDGASVPPGLVVEDGPAGQVLLLRRRTARGLIWSRRSPLFQVTRPHLGELPAPEPDDTGPPTQLLMYVADRGWPAPPAAPRAVQLPRALWLALLALLVANLLLLPALLLA